MHSWEWALTSLFDSLEVLNVQCTIEFLGHLGQIPLHFYDHTRIDLSANRSRCDHQHMRDVGNAITYRGVHV